MIFNRFENLTLNQYIKVTFYHNNLQLLDRNLTYVTLEMLSHHMIMHSGGVMGPASCLTVKVTVCSLQSGGTVSTWWSVQYYEQLNYFL